MFPAERVFEMKIGVITFHRAINYGAALQTYALQRAISDLGFDTEVIDYRCDHMENLYKLIGGFKQKTFKQNIRGLINLIPSWKKMKSFRSLIASHTKLSPVVYDSKSIVTANQCYDVFITGSDQVFNYACSNFDKNYFLSFVEETRKINSYAASFGISEIPQEYKGEYTRLLNRFNHISVREESGRRIVRELTGKDCALHVDPVFLLDSSEWSKLAKDPGIDNYILIYRLNKSNIIDDFARKLAKKTGKRVINIGQDLIDKIKNPDFGGDLSTSVEEFLGLFKYADYVVTNSFHGTAFSVIFNRKMYVETKQKDFKKNDRAENLLKLTGLTDSIISTLDDCNLDIIRDFEHAKSVLSSERESALSYLRGICSNE